MPCSPIGFILFFVNMEPLELQFLRDFLPAVKLHVKALHAGPGAEQESLKRSLNLNSELHTHRSSEKS